MTAESIANLMDFRNTLEKSSKLQKEGVFAVEFFVNFADYFKYLLIALGVAVVFIVIFTLVIVLLRR